MSLKETKTDKVDAHTIASMIMSDVNLKSYSHISYHNEELKSLTRYRFGKAKERAQLKQSISRFVTILFLELEKLVLTLHMASVYALLAEFPSVSSIASAHLTKLTNLLSESPKGRFGKDTAVTFRESAKSSINSPILTVPGINYRMGAMIIAEIGVFSRFDSPNKILAYASMSPSSYQSGQLDNCYAHMEKRGSRYLQYALYNATKYVCHWDESLGSYLAKKRAEEKHYNVALSHATKKLVRLIYQSEKSGQSYVKPI